MKDATKVEKSSLYKSVWIFLFGLIFLSLPSLFPAGIFDSRHSTSGGVSFVLISFILILDHLFSLKLIKKLIPYTPVLYCVFYYILLSFINIHFNA